MKIDWGDLSLVLAGVSFLILVVFSGKSFVKHNGGSVHHFRGRGPSRGLGGGVHFFSRCCLSDILPG